MPPAKYTVVCLPALGRAVFPGKKSMQFNGAALKLHHWPVATCDSVDL